MAIPSNMTFPQDFIDIFGEKPAPATPENWPNAASPSRARQEAESEYLQHFSTFLSKADVTDAGFEAFYALCEKIGMGTPKPFYFLRNGTEKRLAFGFSKTAFPYRWESEYIAKNAPLQVVATYQTKAINQYGIAIPLNVLANIVDFETREKNEKLLEALNG